ncbi:hypothetical protein DFH07DRAFT_964353 [Mycena maculata]|uniref:Uncharacterized protein n=1 Tax=Mycena maculata TaxID=230809 RepID=A0AAD7N2M2_9AGAR|nr:hypothetical protein DFH07DRAFT_964353 [Mycena maculata]
MKSPPPQRTKFRLTAPKKHVTVNFIDDEAEEDDRTEDEDENDSGSDEDGLKLLYPDEEEEPSVSTQSTGPIQDVSEPTAPPKNIRGHTPPLKTRAMSQRAQKKKLNTSGLEQSTSDAINGVKSSAIVIPAGQRNTQKRLAVTVKQEPREGLSLSAEEYDDFLRYKASLDTTPARSATKPPVKAKTPVAKRKERSPSEEISQSPKTPSKGKKPQGPPALKKAKVARGAPVLQTEDVLKVTKLPKKCKVTNEDVQDPLAKELYTNLPPLLRCVFLSWSPDTGPGNMMYSSWEDVTPYMNFE